MNDNIVDFPDRKAVDDAAAEWLIRMDGDEPLTADELAALREWTQRSPVHRERLAELAGLWNRLNRLTDLNVPQSRAAAEERASRRAVPSPWRYQAAAVLVLAIGALALWQLRTVGPTVIDSPAEDTFLSSNGRYTTAVGEQRSIELADGSAVMLNTDSELTVHYRSGYRDLVLVRGEAHFSVAKDAGRPFSVFAGGRRVQAVGTAFSVYLKGSSLDVTVTEGRVSLASVAPAAAGPPAGAGQPGPGALLEPDAEILADLGTFDAGQSVTVRSASGDAGSVRDTVEPLLPSETGNRLSWREGMLTFTGQPLETVVEEISRYTPLTIDYADASIRERRIGGRFPIGETEFMLDTLEANFGLRVTRLADDRVLLSAGDD